MRCLNKVDFLAKLIKSQHEGFLHQHHHIGAFLAPDFMAFNGAKNVNI
ncbi:hypothetical protein F-VV10_0174 [Faustovirus]|nr:hypothetical protein F-VV10_0174 [Faustovirus]